MKRFLIGYIIFHFLFLGYLSARGNCPQIDLNKKDTDSMPFCPEEVKTQSAWAVFNCAITQTNKFSVPSTKQIQNSFNLLNTWVEERKVGKSPALAKKMLGHANAIGLQGCRVSQQRDGKEDSYLLFYAKKDVTNYNGAFLMLRETKSSKVIIVAPHDDFDSTEKDTKFALSETSAMAVISSGHRRQQTPNTAGGKNGDFSHEEKKFNLGTHMVEKMGKLYPGSVWLHIHGMRDQTKFLVRSRSPILEKAFKEAAAKHSGINVFQKFNADYTIEPLVNTNWYLKTEFPSKVHRQKPYALAEMVKDFEKNDWAWSK